MQRRIFWSMLAVVAVALLIALAGTSVLRQRAIDERRRELTRQAAVTAVLIEEQLPRVGRDGGNARAPVGPLLEQLRRVGGHDYLEAGIVRRSGEIETLVEGSPLLEATDRQAVRLARSGDVRATFETEVEGESIIANLQLIELAPPSRLMVIIAVGRQEPLLDASPSGLRGLLAFGVGALLAAAVAGILARRIGRRVGVVGHAANRLAEGDFGVRASLDGDDDISELADAFNRMAEQLEALRDREREFLLSVGHDLRTPLTTIRGYAEGLHSGVIAGGDLPRVAELLDTQTTRLSRLIEDLMLLARLEAREFTIRFERVDLASLVEGLLEADRARADRLGVALHADLADVGEAMLDPDRFGQMMGNLLDNAFRYAPEGSEVVVSLRSDEEDAVLRITDRGPGIEEAHLERIFERLYVAQRYRPLRPEGSGLGLSIVRELVGALGGTVTAESTVGRGTSIVVRLPRLTDELPNA